MRIVIVCFLFISMVLFATEPVFSTSIFNPDIEEAKIRGLTEKMIFIQVIKNSTSKDIEEEQFLKKISEMVEKKFARSYRNLPSEKSFERIKGLNDSNEKKLALYLQDSIKEKSDYEKILKNIPEISFKEDNAVFYQKYLEELVRLDNLFPEISSQIATYSEREVTGEAFEYNNILLTFDDGPSVKTTPKIIDVLNENNVKAVFFVVAGTIGKKNSELVERELESGFTVGSHSMTHANLLKIKDKAKIEYEFAKSKEIIEERFNCKVNYFRAPYGARTKEESEEILKIYQKHILWNIDSQDWNSKFSAETVKERVIRLNFCYNGGITLFHDTNKKSSEILDEIIKRLKASGFIFVEKIY